MHAAHARTVLCSFVCYLCFAFNTTIALILLWRDASHVPVCKISFNHRFFHSRPVNFLHCNDNYFDFSSK